MKNSYVLLRNNRESASLYLEDLQKIGLKPTDLIWVECQSVGWRCAEEIPELKPLLSEDNIPDKKISSHESKENIMQPLEIIPAKNIEKKLVFEEFLTREEFLKKDGVKPLTDPFLTTMKKYGDPDHLIHPALDKEVIDLQTNYSRPLDEIKEMYVKNPEQKEQRKKSILEIRLPQPLKKIALNTGLVMAGALIMLLIKNTGDKSPTVFKPVHQQPETVIATTSTPPTVPEKSGTATELNDEQQNFPHDKIPDIPSKEQKPSVAVNRNMPVKKTDEKIENQEVNTEKNTNPVQGIKAVKSVTTENISSKISLKANDYNVGAFGGIRNLVMTLQNDSKYLLDKVTVEIKYLNPEGIILKTDNIYFQFIQPGDAATIPVNKTKRGVKVDYKITKIESKELVSANPVAGEPDNYSRN